MKPATLTLLAATFLTAGCSTKDQYYRLTPTGTPIVRTTGRAVAVGPVTLPTYVDRAELVFQSGPNRFEIPVKARWAGALGENFSQVLAADLGRHLDSGNVVANPAPGETRFRHRVTVTVLQFHAVSGHGAILEASWRIETTDTRQVLRTGSGEYHAPISGDGYAPVVAAESDLVEQLAAAISPML